MAEENTRVIVGIIYNWIPDPQLGMGIYSSFFVGNTKMQIRSVTHIEEHLSRGEGDRLWYDVYFTDGSMTRVFNVNQVHYRAPAAQEKPCIQTLPQGETCECCHFWFWCSAVFEVSPHGTICKFQQSQFRSRFRNNADKKDKKANNED